MGVFSRRQDIMTFNTGMVDPVVNFNSRFLTNRQRAKYLAKAVINKKTNLDSMKTIFHKDNSVYRNIATKHKITEVRPYYPINKNQSIFPLEYSNDVNKKYYEDPLKINTNSMVFMNNYRYQYASPLNVLMDMGYVEGDDRSSVDNVKIVAAPINVAMSMFNPLYMINVKGISSNVPLLNSPTLNKNDYVNNLNNSSVPNLSNCTIKELVSLSHQDNSILGQERYRYADFMFCKDLGKISNNHLITLRVFPYPVGDHIQEYSSPIFHSSEYDFSQVGDVGRLVTWFGTEDNKLEDILTYDYHATWRPLESQIEEVTSEEDSEDRGILGKVINTFSASYNESVGKGIAGTHSFWNRIGGDKPRYANHKILGNYDKNKVYEPKDTIQNTHVYEGKLIFNHEFTIKFCYRMRAYDNINTKSAFLDLIGNILAVTYRRGKFWGGDRKFIGPPQNKSAWNKANAIIDNTFDKMGGIFEGLRQNSFTLESIMGSMSSLVDMVKGLGNDVKGAYNKLAGEGVSKKIMNALQTSGLGQAFKGALKNKLGRPALYAMQSLLSGDDVGLWHLTVGNPKNPIVSIGNLILDRASIQHSGPLGLDDFPTDITVTVTLKHARGRDAVEIGRMYTKGLGGIYMLPQLGLSKGQPIGKMIDKTRKVITTNDNDTSSLSPYYNFGNFGDSGSDSTAEKEYKAELEQLGAARTSVIDAGSEELMKSFYTATDPNNNVLTNTNSIRYEWHNQTMLSAAKRVIDEIR